MNTRSIVSITRCPDYSIQNVRAAVDEALNLAGLADCFASNQNVLLKPNLLSTRLPDEAITTHPAVVQAIGEIAQRHGAVISLGDSPPFAGENEQKYAKLCRQTGMTDAAASLNAELIRFEDSSAKAVNPNGRFYKSFDIAQAVLDTDLLINIPKLKTHGLTGITGAVKNIFGCIPGIRKGLFHAQAAEDRETFAQMLVDLLGVIKPRVNIMDAVVALEGDGPNAGSPKQIGLILASSDPVALDAVACAIVGIDPWSIDMLRLAHEQGLGCADLQSIDIKGESIEAVRIMDFKISSGKNDWNRIPYPIRQALRKQLIASPGIDSDTCIGCGDCVKVCPIQAMTPGKPPSIDLDKCIRCYCCHEVCNPNAVVLRRGWLGELLLEKRTKR